MVMSSLSSRNTFHSKYDHKLSWDISCSDDSADGEELTSLVRTSYMKHLKSCLSKNYEKWSKTNIPVQELNFCSKMLEKKALRSCMVTSLYQRAMTHIVNDIKKATQNEILYEGFRKKLDIFESIRCDKETQTVDELLEDIKRENKPCNVEILLNNNSNSSNSNSKSLFLETFGESESAINMKLEQAGNDLHTYEELLNMLLSSPKETDINNEVENINSATPNEDNRLIKKRKLFNGNPESNDSLKITEPDLHPAVTLPSPKVEESHTNLQNDNKISSSLLVNWQYELFVQNTHLENILMKLKPHKRIIVEKRFKDLFGNNIVEKDKNNKALNISEEELNLCRKRIARIIVGELTPFYVEGRIGSRPVFKNLAKKLTDDILCTTLTPDPTSIRKTVRGIFLNGKQIYSLKDAF